MNLYNCIHSMQMTVNHRQFWSKLQYSVSRMQYDSILEQTNVKLCNIRKPLWNHSNIALHRLNTVFVFVLKNMCNQEFPQNKQWNHKPEPNVWPVDYTILAPILPQCDWSRHWKIDIRSHADAHRRILPHFLQPKNAWMKLRSLYGFYEFCVRFFLHFV